MAAIAPQAQRLSPLGLSGYRLSGSGAIAFRAIASWAQQLSPLGLSGYRLSGSMAIASPAQRLSPPGLISYRPPGSSSSRAQQLSPFRHIQAQQLSRLVSAIPFGLSFGPRALLPLRLPLASRALLPIWLCERLFRLCLLGALHCRPSGLFGLSDSAISSRTLWPLGLC